MKVLESLIMGKFNNEQCEDFLFISDDFIGVIDGVSSKTSFRYRGKTTGRLAAGITAQILQALPADAGFPEIIRRINAAFENFYEQTDFPEPERREKGLQAVCALYSRHRRTLWQIGDCQIMVDGKEQKNPKKSDRILCDMRNLILAELKQRDGAFRPSEHEKEILSALFPWMVQTSLFANSTETDYGYSVLNGLPIPPALVNTIVLDSSPHEIVLASDGYPRLCPTLAESECELAKMLREDPLGCRLFDTIRFLAEDQKSFDDRTYIRFLTD